VSKGNFTDRRAGSAFPGSSLLRTLSVVSSSIPSSSATPALSSFLPIAFFRGIRRTCVASRPDAGPVSLRGASFACIRSAPFIFEFSSRPLRVAVFSFFIRLFPTVRRRRHFSFCSPFSPFLAYFVSPALDFFFSLGRQSFGSGGWSTVRFGRVFRSLFPGASRRRSPSVPIVSFAFCLLQARAPTDDILAVPFARVSLAVTFSERKRGASS